MNLKRAISLDMICWVVLLIAVWMGPQWVIKVALSIMIVWNALCVSFLSKCIFSKPGIQISNDHGYMVPGQCCDPDCNCEAHLEEYTGQNFN
jgi:hypothetical protein